MSISFLPSQRGDKSQTPLPYTADPYQQLIADFVLCFSEWRHIFGILMPIKLNPRTADPYGELYPNLTNIKCLILHGILVVCETIFLLTIPLLLVVPVAWLALYFVGFFVVKWFFCYLLNGSELTYEPDEEIVRDFTDHQSEYWIYLNGVSVGRDWLKSNINRLSVTFGRKVHGVLNRTDGILFDLIQCLIERNFTYATRDVRESYVKIKNALYDEKITKVVFIIHSQGGLEGSLIIDWLLAEVPTEKLHQLEVYSFGNAANHFNNPNRCSSNKGIVTHESPVARSALTYASTAIGHIEHYANIGDYVAQIGVLHFALSPEIHNRFMGRLFTSPLSGHLLNEHYLHEMFPLGKDGRCLDHNPFMEMPIEVFDLGDNEIRKGAEESVQCLDEDDSLEGFNATEATAKAKLVTQVASVANVDTPVRSVEAAATPHLNGKGVLNGNTNSTTWKVKNVSRLWLYRNGGTPPDIPV